MGKCMTNKGWKSHEPVCQTPFHDAARRDCSEQSSCRRYPGSYYESWWMLTISGGVLKYPQIIIPFRLGVSMKYCKSEKLLGYEHDYGNLHIQCLKLIKCGSQHTGAKPQPICSRSFRKVLESIISVLSSQQTTSSRPFREKIKQQWPSGTST